jgi:hypothetical protein
MQLSSMLLLTLWTAAWLHWMFRGHLRAALTGFLLPRKWLAGEDRRVVAAMPEDDLTFFISAVSFIPGLPARWLTCPACMSASISALGVAILWCAGESFPTPHRDDLLLLLVWAGGAWGGHTLFRKL